MSDIFGAPAHSPARHKFHRMPRELEAYSDDLACSAEPRGIAEQHTRLNHSMILRVSKDGYSTQQIALTHGAFSDMDKSRGAGSVAITSEPARKEGGEPPHSGMLDRAGETPACWEASRLRFWLLRGRLIAQPF